jgi:hypothetical protein
MIRLKDKNNSISKPTTMKIFIPFLLLLTACTSAKSTTTNPITGASQPTETVVTPTNQEKGEITGVVHDDLGEPLIGAKVILLSGEKIITGCMTDLDGKFRISNIEPGTYDVEVNYVGYSSKKIEDIVVNGFQKIDFIMINMPDQEVILLKPVIYLYPEKEMKINVSMDYTGKLTYTYPAYPISGWNVTASPDGTLINEKGQEYYALFWEGKPEKPIKPTDGFVIEGSKTVAFLEEKLAQLGLNRREANEFIMFWMPQMENNNYNFIHFASSEYEAISKLNITPKPETVIRVMMLTQPLENKIEIIQQDITPLKIERKGYTVVEWGGSILTTPIKG